eukprot:2456860-Rhodomonas_salina.4
MLASKKLRSGKKMLQVCRLGISWSVSSCSSSTVSSQHAGSSPSSWSRFPSTNVPFTVSDWLQLRGYLQSHMSSIGSRNKAASLYCSLNVSDAPTLRQFLHVAGDATVPDAHVSPASPTAVIVRKSGFSHVNASTSLAFASYRLQ